MAGAFFAPLALVGVVVVVRAFGAGFLAVVDLPDPALVAVGLAAVLAFGALLGFDAVLVADLGFAAGLFFRETIR